MVIVKNLEQVFAIEKYKHVDKPILSKQAFKNVDMDKTTMRKERSIYVRGLCIRALLTILMNSEDITAMRESAKK